MLSFNHVKGWRQMMTTLKYTAIASAFLLTAGSAAFAQNYNGGYNNEGNGGGYTQGYNGGPGYNGNEGWNQGQQGWNQGEQGQGMQGQGMQGWNQGPQGWNQGEQGNAGSNQNGSSGQYGEYNNGSGSGAGNMGMSENQAVQELRHYGYNNLNGIRPMQGYSADAEINGQHVHIILGDNGEVATFRGRQ
jgi:hypothetical protein